MPGLKYYLSPDQVNTFEADRWLAQQNTRIADDWMQKQVEQLQAPTPSDSLTNPPLLGSQDSAGSMTDSPVPPSLPSPAGPTTPEPAPAFPAPEPSLPAPTAPALTDFGPVPQPTPQRSPLPAPPAVPSPAPTPTGGFVDYARQAAQRAGIDPDLFVRQINQESGFSPTAGSPAGARGIAQIVPKYHPGVDVTDPYASLDYAAGLMSNLIKQHGGDIRTALVAYNGGAGAVQALNAGTPYRESTDYVNKIMGGAGQTVASVPVTTNLSLSQFGDRTLSADEAYAACGPAAAARLAAEYGNAIPLSAALAAAKQVGWTPGGGMNGILNEKKLMDALNLPAELDTSGDWNRILSGANSGQLVTISTSGGQGLPVAGGHYFSASAVRQRADGQTELYVGQSGKDLKAGKDWMTPQEIMAVAGPINGALFSDPSKAVTAGDWYQQAVKDHGVPQADPAQVIGELGQARQKAGIPQAADETVTNPFGEAMRQLGAVKDQVGGAVGGLVSSGAQPMTAAMQPTPSDSLTNPTMQQNPTTPPLAPTNLPPASDTLGQAVSDFGSAVGRVAGDVVNTMPEGSMLRGGMNLANAAVPATDLSTSTMQPGGALALQAESDFQRQRTADDERAASLFQKSGLNGEGLTPDEKAWLTQYTVNNANVLGSNLKTGPLTPVTPGGRANQTLLDMYGKVKMAPTNAIPSQLEETRRFLVRKWTDRGVDLAEFQKDAERAAGRPLNADEMAYQLRRLNPAGAADIRIQNELKPAVQSVGQDADWLKVYLTHQDNIDVGAAMGNPNRAFSGGLSAADSQAGLNEMAQQLGPERMAKVESAANQVWDYGRNLLQRKVESGLISQDLFDQLTTTYPHYSPTRIVDYLKDAQNLPSGRKITVTSAGLKRNTIEGTTRQREDPLASFVRSGYETEALATKNQVAQAFLKLRDLTPDGDLMVRPVADDLATPRGFEKMKVFTDGVPQSYMMPDYIAKAIREEPVAPIPILAPMMNLFRTLATQRNPVFLASNALNDAATYTLRSSSRLGGPQNAPKVLTELFKAYGDAFQGVLQGEYRGGATQRYIGGGGAMSGFFSRRPEDAAKVADALQRTNAIEIRSGHALEDVKRLIGQALTLKPVEAIGERIELAPRVAAMRLAEQAGASSTEAVLAGRTVTMDFSQGGTWAKTLNQAIPFFNVGVQAGTQIPRAFAENPKGFLATALTLLAAPTVGFEAWNRSDPQRAQDYADVPQYVKDAGMVFMLPTAAQTDEKGNRKPQYLFFPTREFTPFVTLTREAAGRAMGADPRGWADLIAGTAKSVSPIQGESGAEAISTFVPLGVSTGMQLATDRDWFRNKAIVSQYADEQASVLSKSIAGALQQMGIQARPSAVEFGIRDVGAGVGGMVLAGADMATGKPRRDERVQSTPGFGGLIGRFVQDRTGELLSRGIDQPVPPRIEQVLKDAGVATPSIPTSISVRSQLTGSNSPPMELRQAERAEYQQLMSQRLTERLAPIINDPSWAQRPIASRNKLLETQIMAARDYAENQIYAKMAPADRQARMVAGREAQKPKPKP